MYNANSPIKFKTSMLKSRLFDYSDAYMLVSAAITIPNTASEGANVKNRKNIIIKNCAPFTNYISKINNPKLYNLIEYSDNYSKILEFYGNSIEMNCL